MSDRSSPTAPPFVGMGLQPDAWDVTFKVKYGDTLKRFYGYVNGTNLDMNLSALRAKIAVAFKFGPGVDFILTYTDEDGDVVMLDDDDDLRDAALHQKLNPLRINVQLRNGGSTERQGSISTPMNPAAQEPLSHILSALEALQPIPKAFSSGAHEEHGAKVKSAISEAIKSIPEPIPDVLAKLSHEVLAAAPPPLTELIKPLVQLITPTNSSSGPSELLADELSNSFRRETQAQMPAKAKGEPHAQESSAAGALNAQNSEPSGTRGLGSILDETGAAHPPNSTGTSQVHAAAHLPSAGASQVQQSSLYPSVEEFLFPSKSVDKSVCKEKSDAQTKGKFVWSSATQHARHDVPSLVPPPPPPSVSEWFHPRRCQPHLWHSETNAKAVNDSNWRVPMYKMPPHSSPLVHHAAPGYGPHPSFPYPGRLLSSGHLYGDHDNSKDNSAPQSLHRWIQCDGCGVQPIIGPRYNSNVKEDYDLCASCFQRLGNEFEYTKIDKPVFPHRSPRDHVIRKVHPRVVMKSKREKLESRFILDVTVLDGTLMAPSTAFTKIWRMHNNGSIMWPLGTQLIWVGGDQFALQTSIPLEIPVTGFPVDKEIDVAVDFVAPARPGRYISNWRLASPSGQKFGQRVWVHIQVDDPSFASDNYWNSAINLNLPPESSNANAVDLIDMNVEPAKLAKEYNLYPVDFKPNEPQPAPLVASVSAASAANPTVDVPLPSGTAAAFVPTPELVNPVVPSLVNIPAMPTLVPVNAPASTSAAAPAPAPASADAATPEPSDVDGHTEEKLLRELEEMGFRQVDLNKEILRQNNYNLEQSVDDLCGVNEWDPLLAELQEMGFDDTEMNKELLAKNGGSIKRAVMDLIAREKKDK